MARDLNLLFTGRKYKEHFDFWRERLRLVGEPFWLGPCVEAEDANPDGQKVFEFCPNERAQNAIQNLAQGQDMGTFVVVLSGFMYLLSKYSGRPVISIKSPLLQRESLNTAYTDDVLM